MWFKGVFLVKLRHWIFYQKLPKSMDFSQKIMKYKFFRWFLRFTVLSNRFILKPEVKPYQLLEKPWKNIPKTNLVARKPQIFENWAFFKIIVFSNSDFQTSDKPKSGLKWFFGGLTKFFKNFRKFWTFLQLTFFLYDAYLLISRTISHFKFLPYEYLAATVNFSVDFLEVHTFWNFWIFRISLHFL